MLGLTHQQDNFPIDTKLCRKDFVSFFGFDTNYG